MIAQPLAKFQTHKDTAKIALGGVWFFLLIEL